MSARGLGPAPAAALKATFPACQDKAVLQKVLQSSGQKGGAKNAAERGERPSAPLKIDAPGCLQLLHGQEVSVDERDGPLWCVRRTGDLDCYWTLDKAVDLNPPLVSTGGHGAQQGGRKGRH